MTLAAVGALAVLLAPAGHAAPRIDRLPVEGLTPPKGSGAVGLDSEYRKSSEYFDSSGHRQSRFSDGSGEEYTDAFFVVGTAYGLTDQLMLWLDFPLVARWETKSLNGEDFGLGDVRAGARYRFGNREERRFQWAAELAAKFPSGDTDLSVADPSRGKKVNLPLGSGNSDITLAALARQTIRPSLHVEEYAGYTFRFDALVEFLQTDAIPQKAPDGSLLVLPVGNLKLDWGDEVDLRARMVWAITSRLGFAADAHYFYRRPTYVKSFAFDTQGESLQISTKPLKSPSGYVLFAQPSVFFEIVPRFFLRFSIEFPVIGENYPTIPIVESLVGQRYQLEARYAF